IRSHMVSQFLLAVSMSTDEGDDKPSYFQSFCRVGSGYTLKELHEFNRKLAPSWKKFDEKNIPQHLLLTSGLRERPDVWIEPSKSWVVQVKAAEIISSNQFKTGCTLRFPRLEKVRDDKAWYQCMTLDEMQSLRQQAGGKLAIRHTGIEDTGEPSKKKARRVIRPSRVIGIASQFRGADVSNVKQVSEMFGGNEFCVVNVPKGHTKTDVEKKIVEHGGSIVQNPGPETYCVLADKITTRVRNIFSRDIYDVVAVTWLFDCLKKGHLLPWLPSHMLHESPDTASEFALEFDRHGDSYTEDVNREKLEEVFNKIEAQGNIAKMTSEDIAEIEFNYFPNDSPLGIFRLCKVYLDKYAVLSQPITKIKDCSLELVELELRFHGARVSPKLDETVTHVICDASDLSRLKDINEMNRGRNKKFHTLSVQWVQDCLEAGTFRSELPYGLKIS
ncbi:DNA ligase 4-like, partial [Saccoglossus kowalevskii]|uniref:DNA ligase 4-like n=1 Tax=Saccoglossus kowalevskii TaxID=10224 RepID=A0ABM0M3I1_SACKO